MQTSFKDGELTITVIISGVDERSQARARRLIIAVHEALTKNIK